MKSVRFVLFTILVLSAFAVPSFAGGIDDDVFGRDPYEAEAASAGESSVEVARSDEAAATENDVFSRDPYELEVASAEAGPDGVPAEVWAAIQSRDGFAALVPGAAAAEAAAINGMPADQWATISGRNGFRTQAGQAKTYSVSEPLFSIVATRDGFDVRANGEPSEGLASNRPATTPEFVWDAIWGRDSFAIVYSDSCNVC